MPGDCEDARMAQMVEAYAADGYAERMNGALQAIHGGPGAARHTGKAPSPQAQLRHEEGSREREDALRRIAGARVRARQQATDAWLNARYGGNG